MKGYPGADKFVGSLGIKRREKVLIVSDNLALRKPVEIIADKCRGISESVELDWSLPEEVLDEIPLRIRNKLMQADVVVFLASQSWYHAPFRQKLKYRFKKRVVESYGLCMELLENGGLLADYQLIEEMNIEFKKKLKGRRSIHIMSSKGTELFAKIDSAATESGLYQKPGSGGNLPAGEISLSILDKSVSGRIIFDLSFDTVGQLRGRTIELGINNNRIVKVSGAHKNKLKLLLNRDSRLKKIAEIGIGTNPFCILGRSILEDEKRMGTLHIGFGNDIYFGGENAGAHYDGILGEPTVDIDDNRVMLEGKISKGLFSKELVRRLSKFGVLN